MSVNWCHGTAHEVQTTVYEWYSAKVQATIELVTKARHAVLRYRKTKCNYEGSGPILVEYAICVCFAIRMSKQRRYSQPDELCFIDILAYAAVWSSLLLYLTERVSLRKSRMNDRAVFHSTKIRL